MEPRLGVPTFLWAPEVGEGQSRQLSAAPRQAAPGIESAARGHLGDNSSLYRLSGEDVAAARLAAIHDTGKGAIIAKFRQEIDGVEVFRDEVKVIMNRRLQLMAISGYLTGSDSNNLSQQGFVLEPTAAITRAINELTGASISDSTLKNVRNNDGAADEARSDTARSTEQNPYLHFTANPTDTGSFKLGEPVRVKKVMYHLVDGYVPAYYIEADLQVPSVETDVVDLSGEAPLTNLFYAYVISAVDGEVLFRHNLTAHQSYTYRVWADPVTKIPYDGPQGINSSPHPTGLLDGFTPTLLAPNDVTLQNFPFSRNDPWLPTGATETVGNNVDAYADLFTPNGYGPVAAPADSATGDFRANITSTGAFQHTYDTTKNPEVSAQQRQAAIQQLFYTVNFLHDWFYDSGFDEAAGNAQTDNYGRGGLGNDSIRAEAQDFGNRNNAFMSTPADGSRPRMQMYIFDDAAPKFLNISAPAVISGQKSVGFTQFAPRGFDVTGQILQAQPAHGCTAFTNASAIAGKIALVDRVGATSCDLLTKILNAQNAGAVGFIMVNSDPGFPFNILGETSAVTIPILTISGSNGTAIKNRLAISEVVTGRMFREASIDLDSALDNQIVAHEWGHYISSRLIGNGSGLNNSQGSGMGEGWGDFHSLLLTVRAEDALAASNQNYSGAYPSASYAPGNGFNNSYYFGGRRLPYSTDFSKNGLTFKHISDGVALPANVPTLFGLSGTNNSEVHATGEVWAIMLWECYAALLRDTLGATPRLTFSEAQSRMKNYLVAAYKMTPVSPTFLEARDAVLAAAFAYDYEDGRLFAQAFARRGAGLNAVAPDRYSVDNVGVTESFDSGGALTYVSTSLDDSVDGCDNDGYLDNGEKGLLRVTLKNTGFQNLFNTTATVSSNNPHVTFPEGATLTFSPSQPGQSVMASITVTVSGVVGIGQSDFTITFQDAGTPAVVPVTTHFFERLNVDEVAAAWTTDTVEAKQTHWLISSNQSLATGSSVEWRRISSSSSVNHQWHAPDPITASDQYLVSPVMTVDGSGSFNLQFDHSWAFEADPVGTPGRAFYDGGRIEASINGGSWIDIGGPIYNGTLANYSGNQNPLRGLAALVGESNGAHVSLTNAIAPGSTIQVRFRFASDNVVGADGWKIDNIAFMGVVETPFTMLVAEADACNVTTPAPTTIGLSPATIPAATVGSPYTATVTPSGGTGPYTYSITPVVMPAGLSTSVAGGNLQISGTPTQAGTFLITVNATDSTSKQGSANYALTVGKGAPTITWSDPSDITYGTALGATQLNATASVPGALTYTTPSGTILGAGAAQSLTVNFTPTDTANYNSTSKTVHINVLKAITDITWTNPSDLTHGTALGSSQLNASASVPGTLTYTPGPGAVLSAGAGQTLSVSFTPTDAANYQSASKTVQVNVLKATPTITWTNPTDITYGTALGNTQLNAVASAPGALVYTPALGTVLSAGINQTLSVDFTPADSANYNSATKTVQINVSKAGQTITFGALSNKTFGDPEFTISATASSSLGVTFAASGQCSLLSNVVRVTGGGSCTITASQAGDSNFAPATDVQQSFNILKASQTITFNSLSNKTFGDPDFSVSGSASSGLPVSFSSSGACTVSGSNVHITGAGACTIKASQAGSSNHDAATDVSQSFTINKASSTTNVMVSNAGFDGQPHGGTATVIGAGNLNQGLTVTYTGRNSTAYGPSTIPPTNAGDYTASATFSGGSNHSSSSDSKEFQIGKADQTINFGTLSNKTFGDVPFNLSATASSGLNVSFSSTTPVVCSLSGTTVTIVGSGACAVTASQAGNGNYNGAAPIQQSFTVSQASTTTNLTSSANPSSLGQSVTFTATVTSTAGTPTGSVQFKDSGVNLGSPVALNSGGAATFNTNTLIAGAHNITAVYSGAANFAASTGSVAGGQAVSIQTSIAVSDVSVSEGDSGTSGAVFTVTLSGPGSVPVSVDYSTVDGAGPTGATAPADYLSASGTLNFAPGEVTKSVTVQVKGDTQNEPDETFRLSLTNPQNGAISDDVGVATILNDDTPVVQFRSGSYQINEAANNTPQGFGSLNVEVVRTGDASEPVTVRYVTSDQSGGNECNQVTGQASQRCDYTLSSRILRFAAGETSKTIQIPIINDGYSEGSEVFYIRLMNPLSMTLGANSQASILIEDDAADSMPVTPENNPYLSNSFFVRMNYLDYLGRDADQIGFAGWTSVLNSCGPEKGFLGAPPACDRAHVSHGFFGSEEFTDKGFLIHRLYEVGLNRLPRYSEFTLDMATLSGFGISDSVRQQNLADYLQQLTGMQEFTNRFQDVSAPAQAALLIQRLEQTANVTLPQTATTNAGQPTQYGRNELIQKRATGEFTIGQTLKAFVEQQAVYDMYFPRGHVTMLYFAYLKRDPDLNDPNLEGWKEWVFVFTNGGAARNRPDIQPRDIHHLIFGFIYSTEYRKRFGQP